MSLNPKTGSPTALIDQDGKIDKIWRGNGWTPSDIISAIEKH